MSWLQRLLGIPETPPAHVQEALDSAAAADSAAIAAKDAVDRYWRARDVNDRANRAILNEYEAAERRRLKR